MRIVKAATKYFAVLAVALTAFGPFSVLHQTPVAHADTCPAGSHSTAIGCVSDTKDANGNYPLIGPDGKPMSTSSGTSSCSGAAACILQPILTFAAQMVYAVGPGFASWVASLSAYFFDFIVRISLLSPTYALDFLATCWNLVLSLANMFFIFILIYAAFTIMLRAETARTMQTLAWVIAIALVVNFSFFFTRVVIDAGNILGVQFYNAVAYNADGSPVATLKTSDGTTNSSTPATPDITSKLMQAIGVDQLFDKGSFDAVSKSLGGDASAQWATFIILIVIFIFVAVIFWILAIALFMVGLKFFMRVIGLWLILVASPLAFVSQTVVNTRHWFQQWLRSLVGLSMYPAVFLFLFWILNTFAGSLIGQGGVKGLLGLGNASGTAAASIATGQYATSTLVTLIANVSIRMMFIITLIYIMLKVSDWVIEQAGGMATTLVSSGAAAIAGGGFRTAASFGAFAGRNTAGRLGYNFAQSQTGKNLLANSKLGIGSSLWRSANALGRSTFDARNSSTVKSAGSRIGVLARASDVNVGRGTQKNRADLVNEQAKRVQAEGEALKASEKEVRDLGASEAKAAERERLDAYIARKSERNASNLRIPSWGALKGSSALKAALDKERAKEAKKEAEKAKAAADEARATEKKAPSGGGASDSGVGAGAGKGAGASAKAGAGYAPTTEPEDSYMWGEAAHEAIQKEEERSYMWGKDARDALRQARSSGAASVSPRAGASPSTSPNAGAGAGVSAGGSRASTHQREDLKTVIDRHFDAAERRAGITPSEGARMSATSAPRPAPAPAPTPTIPAPKPYESEPLTPAASASAQTTTATPTQPPPVYARPIEWTGRGPDPRNKVRDELDKLRRMVAQQGAETKEALSKVGAAGREHASKLDEKSKERLAVMTEEMQRHIADAATSAARRTERTLDKKITEQFETIPRVSNLASAPATTKSNDDDPKGTGGAAVRPAPEPLPKDDDIPPQYRIAAE